MIGNYINLKERVDRKQHFESNVKTKMFFSNINHMDAITHPKTTIGCSKSHLNILEKFKDTIEPYIAVMEDDFCFLNQDNFNDFVKDFELIKDSIDWKVIVLTPSGNSVHGTSEMANANFKRIMNNQTTTGYIIKKEMIPILITNIKESIEMQLQGLPPCICAIDIYWKKLQDDYPFYYYSKIFAGQLPGWSCIENRVVNYNLRFIQQQYL
jgi:GR25 family glycosyltransferase involved in LPS biosynthesis